MSYWEAFVLAIIEGITEFLPISSTGHMILGSKLMNIQSTEFQKTYLVCIQLGAILSVVVLYYKKFFQSIEFYFKLAVAVIPTLALGFIFNDLIDSFLESTTVVAINLVLGGVVLIFIDNWIKNNDDNSEGITYWQGIKIGFYQSIAMIPGVSRSAASTIGGMSLGFSRRKAAEFSFFLAV
ncbi:MAG: undecaprenyl-diphosphate phosphatase, partial [Cytophagales bacterium]